MGILVKSSQAAYILNMDEMKFRSYSRNTRNGRPNTSQIKPIPKKDPNNSNEFRLYDFDTIVDWYVSHNIIKIKNSKFITDDIRNVISTIREPIYNMLLKRKEEYDRLHKLDFNPNDIDPNNITNETFLYVRNYFGCSRQEFAKMLNEGKFDEYNVDKVLQLENGVHGKHKKILYSDVLSLLFVLGKKLEVVNI